MKKNQKQTIVAGRILIMLFLFLGSHALVYSEGNGSWHPSFTQQLGLKFVEEPWNGDVFDELHATLANPSRIIDTAMLDGDLIGGLAGFKRGQERRIPDFKEGMAVKITAIGHVDWTVKIDGKDMHPARFRLEVAAVDFSAVFEPDKETLKLKIVPEINSPLI